MMKRKSGKANILRRIEELEARTIDGSGLVLHSPEWLAFWQRQVSLYETGDENVRLTLEGVRAVMQATPDSSEAAATASCFSRARWYSRCRSFDVTSTYRIVISGSAWPSNFINAGKVTLERIISLAYVCLSWCGTMRVVIPAAAVTSWRQYRS
jgi:hypothetical protein